MDIGIDNRFLTFALFLTVAGCGNDAVADASAGDEPAFQRVINVEVQPLAPSAFEERVQLTGTAQANRDVVISAEEAGVIREIVTEEGIRVSEGQAILRIDDTILRAQVAEAEARAALARETWERRRRLFEDDGVGSELAYLEARYQAEQATAAMNTLSERLARTVIRAPIDGILESREVELGTMVSPGVPVARVVEINPIKVSGGVPERYAADVTAGSEAVVTFDVLPGEAYPGRVHYVGATVNPRNRTFRVELVLSNPGRIIKPEMVANIEILRRTVPDAIVVPQEALVRVEDGFVAFVIGADEAGVEVAEIRSLELGPAQRNEVVVESGLASGDRLIVLGQNLVANGDRVRVVRTRGELQAGGEQ
jgi:membrane fusion protein (multidrug efflux system)